MHGRAAHRLYFLDGHRLSRLHRAREDNTERGNFDDQILRGALGTGPSLGTAQKFARGDRPSNLAA
jgi:hypothetical protein